MEFGILSILPSILAIVLALATKNVFLALFASLLVGNFILSGYSLMGMLVGTKDMIVNVLSSSSSTSIIIILLTLGGMFYLIEKAGGLKGFTALMIKKRSIVKSRVGAELFTWLIGVLVFIDGTLSVMITGSISRPLTKAFGISPEKTAWIVHSTATPMSILVPIAAYGPYIASFIEAQGIENPTTQMVRGIGFNFYCIFAVLGVAVFVLLKKDFGPMKKAEAAYIAAATGSVSGEDDSDIAGDPSKAKFLLIPMVVMIVVTIAYIFYSGSGNLMDGDAETGLIFGIMAGTIYLIIAMAVTKMGSVMNNISTFFQGCGNMMDIVAIMVFAYALSNLLGSLGTADYLSGVLVKLINPAIFTAIAFLFTCVISFATGTSAGTIAIMMPILLPMALALNVHIPMIVGAVAGGAVFGDHSSPISDTTIMTCSSTDCDVVSHVKTQLPYSLCFAGGAIVLYLILGFIL